MNVVSTSLTLFCFALIAGCGPSKSTSEMTSEIDEYRSDPTEEAGKEKRPSPPKSASGVFEGATIQVDYSSPGVKGRTIFGDLVPYGELWRTGANEATVFSISDDLLIKGELLPAGSYALFTIPDEPTWTLIFNKKANQWGGYNYNSELDALRLKVEPQKLSELVERMQFRVEPEGSLFLEWEWTQIEVPIAKP